MIYTERDSEIENNVVANQIALVLEKKFEHKLAYTTGMMSSSV